MRERRRSSSRRQDRSSRPYLRAARSQGRSDRPPRWAGRSLARSTGRQPEGAYRTGQKPETSQFPGCRPVDRTTDRPGRSTARSTGSQTGPGRVCLGQIYSGSVIFVLFQPEVVPDAYISAQDAPLVALDHI